MDRKAGKDIGLCERCLGRRIYPAESDLEEGLCTQCRISLASDTKARRMEKSAEEINKFAQRLK